MQAIFYCIRGLSRLISFYSFIYMTFFRVTCNMSSTCGLWCKNLLQRAKIKYMFIIIILYYCQKQRVSLMNKIYTDRVISSKQCRRRTMKNQLNKPEVNIYSLPSLVTSHERRDSFCPWKVNSFTKGTFIQVLASLSRLIVVSIEFDSSVIAER